MNKHLKKLVSSVLTVMMALSVTVGTSFNKTKAAELKLGEKELHAILEQKNNAKISSQDNINRLIKKYGISREFDDNKPITSNNPDELVRVIVELKEQPTSKAGTKTLANIKSNQDTVISNIKKSIMGVTVRNKYTTLINGFSMTVKRSEINNIKKISGVLNVTEAKVYYPDMTTAKGLTQAYDAWEKLGYKGEGMVVSIIDTGIDVKHKDMKLTDASKAKLQPANSAFTTKVPYGYNFADRNNIVKDLTSSMHGMHVAGIVGSNGNSDEVDKKEAIQGVAPEAQLLAMKVFSNDANNAGAFSDDIVAAIEESVAHGADVINMSLGSTASFQDPEDPEQKAIKVATEQGVMVVVSAGNSQYSTAPYKFADVVDTGLVGSPGLAHESLQVASYENSSVTCPALTYKVGETIGTMAYFTSDVNPLGVLKGEYELIDCGIGDVPNFEGKDLKGKIALIERGVLSFIDKKKNAQEAGAIGAIVFNNAANGDSYVSMVTDPSITIPAIFISNTDGKTLKSGIGNGVKVSYEGKVKTVGNVASADMSDFTSWGPTPNLDFKPEISAPGGNIYSTVNNNQYESMSGTSMAAPHTSGAEALIMQALKNNNKSLTGKDLVEFAKTTTINTAKIEMDKAHPTVPYSPRRQGAGMIQIVDAINNKVSVKDDSGNATVALKQMGKEKSFNLTLKSISDKEETFNLVSVGGVLTETTKNISTMSYDVAIPGATVSFDKNSVKVPAKGTANVVVTIKLPSDFATEQFVEGFVRFNSTVNSPSLVVPFMGFYGDWSKPQTVDGPIWDYYSMSGSTLVGSYLDYATMTNSYVYLGMEGLDQYDTPIINPDKIAISPNGDEFKDEVIPALYLLRNAKELSVEVLDKDGKIVRTVSKDRDVRKNIYVDTPDQKLDDNWGWDGLVYDSASGEYVQAPEGQYSINVKTKVDFEGAKEQNLEMPVKVDLTAPVLDITSGNKVDDTKYELTWTATDGYSGLAGETLFVVNGQVIEGAVVTEKDGVYSTELNLNKGYNNILVLVEDFAGNMNGDEVVVKASEAPLSITFDNLESGMLSNSNEFAVTGELNYLVKSLQINGKEAELFPYLINDKVAFFADITDTLKQGVNFVTVKAVGLLDEILADYSVKVYYDTVAPEINVTKPAISEEGKIIINQLTNNKYVVEGNAKDNTFGYRLYVNGNQIEYVNLSDPDEAKTVRNFKYEVPVTVGSKFLEVKAVDIIGNTNAQVLPLVINAPIIGVSGISESGLYNTSVKPVVNLNNNTYTYTMKLNGNEYNGSDITKNGSYKLEVTAKNGEYTSTYTVNFAIDTEVPTAPELSADVDLTTPTNSDVKVTAKYSNDTVKMEYRIGDTAAWHNYTNPIVMKENGTIQARGTDQAGNVSGITSLIVTNIDKVAPNKPRISPNTVAPTNSDIIVEIADWSDAVKKEYKINDGQWIDYTKPITITENITIYARGTDAAGNTSEVASFKVENIDKTAPVITVNGVQDKGLYNKSVVPVITVDDKDSINAVTLNNEAFDGKPIEKDGSYTLKVTATDKVGNKGETTISFTIDKTLPSIAVSGVDNNGVYNKAVTPIITVDDKDAITVVTLNNSTYDGKAVDKEGSYSLKVTSVDKAGNKCELVVNFTIDKTAPVITIEGIENDKVYENVASAKIKVNEGNIVAKLNGKDYNGELIAAVGDYTIDVSSIDLAGNVSSKTVKFSIKAVLGTTTESAQALANAIANSKEQNVSIALINSSNISKALFEALANNSSLSNSDKIVSFNVNGITFSFNVRDINKNNLKDIDLALNLSAPNKDIIVKLDANAQILSFKENGVLPAPLTARVKADGSKLDLTKPLYFYYYNPVTKSTELIAGPVTPDEDGYVSITIKHCSDYFLSNDDSVKITATADNIPQLGSTFDTNVLVAIGSFLIAIGAAFVILQRKRKKLNKE